MNKERIASGNWDVIVAGGGFAGVGAAVVAARKGAAVLLIDRYNCCGGAAAFDLVNPFMRYWTKEEGGRKYLSAGIFSEITSMLEAGGALEGGQRFGTEYLKLVMNRLLLSAGVDILYDTEIVSAEAEDGRVSSVKVSNVSGISEFTAGFFIDCTGDANLSAMAGFGYRVGREPDGLCQPMTLCFRLGGVDREKLDKAEINRLYSQFRDEGRIKNPRENVLMFDTLERSVIHFNTTRIVRRDPTDAWEVTEAEIEAREQIDELVRFLKENFEAFRSAVLISSGLRIGARESRMIDGLYTLTRDDRTSFTKFPDGIAACNYDIDIHSPDGTGTSHWYFPDGCWYTVPYRCLVPKRSRNLLAAGRCVSCDHDAQASLRIMPVCCTLGEAAGTAAAICLREGTDAAGVDTGLLRRELKDAGCVVD